MHSFCLCCWLKYHSTVVNDFHYQDCNHILLQTPSNFVSVFTKVHTRLVFNQQRTQVCDEEPVFICVVSTYASEF
jgi:hypothetical protein